MHKVETVSLLFDAAVILLETLLNVFTLLSTAFFILFPTKASGFSALGVS